MRKHPIAESVGLTAGGVRVTSSSVDYTYDANGNVILDKNKGITEIFYNHLNLPTYISFANGNAIEYLYNAAGQKVKKRVYDNTVTPNTIKDVHYLDGFQYAGDVLQFFPHAEGYVNVTANSGISGLNYIYNYVYNYTDHLGNIRMSFSKDPVNNQLKILEESHYYPFGLKHAVYSAGSLQQYQLADNLPGADPVARPTYVTKTDYQYKYNGKELQDELGLNWYDYGARNYDPALGRWMNIDPLAENYSSYTPYTYAINNPMFFVDPNGKWISVWNEEMKTTNRYVDGKLYAYNKETEQWDTEVTVDANSYTGQILSALNQIADDSNSSFGKDFLGLFSNDEVNVTIQENKFTNDNAGINAHTNGMIYTSFDQNVDLSTTAGVKRNDFYLTLFHEVAHAYSFSKFDSDIRGKEWYKVPQGNERDKKVSYDEVYASTIENIFRSANSLPLRTHYTSGMNESTVIERTTKATLFNPATYSLPKEVLKIYNAVVNSKK